MVWLQWKVKTTRKASIYQHHRLPFNIYSAHCILCPSSYLSSHRKIHHTWDKQLRRHMVHPPLHFHLCDRNPGASVERSRDRGLVAHRAVLGHRRNLSPSLCSLPRPSKSACRHRYQLHCHFQSNRRWRRLCRTIRVQMDHSTHPTHYCACCQHHRNSCRSFLPHQQRVPVMGPPCSESCSSFGWSFICIRSSKVCSEGRIERPLSSLFGQFCLLLFSPFCGWGSIRLLLIVRRQQLPVDVLVLIAS